MNRDEFHVGDSPGYGLNLDCEHDFASVPRALSQMDGSDVPVRLSAHPIAADCPSNSIVAPSLEEMCDALAMGGAVDLGNSQECFRVLFAQNNVILREAICSRRLLLVERSASRSSTLSSMTTSGTSAGSSGSSQKKLKLSQGSPPKVFCCPLCSVMLNEKDFDRHVLAWVKKVGKRVVHSGDCPGIQDLNHPLISRFPHGELVDRVDACSSDIRSLLHPGAYDSLSPEGSGRHIIVSQRIAAMMQSI
jgi:hypothetical protein